jgi:hypothetical protein
VTTPIRFSPLRALFVVATLFGCKDSSGPEGNDPANLTIHAGADQHALSGAALTQALAVCVTDANDQPVSGTTVTFAVQSGGSITGGTAVTNSDGVATAGTWTLGTIIGANTVQASVPGVAPVIFTATARCLASGTVALDGTASGSLSATDCVFGGGERTDILTFTTGQQRAVRFSQTSTAFDTYLELYDNTGQLLAANDDSADVNGYPTSSLKMLLASGTYGISPSSYLPDRVGAYSVSAVSVPESTNSCELVFAMPGITTVGELALGDCTASGFNFEKIGIVLRAGRTYTITMTSTVFDTYLELAVLQGGLVASNDDAAGLGTNARIVFTPTQSNFYVLVPSSKLTNVTGSFTLTIQ